MKKIDLHLHTTSSDGNLTPKELVAAAKERNLAAIAITDHDSISGITEALEEGEKLGVEVVPGIELTTYYKGERVDILGYYIDWEDEALLEILEKLQTARKGRAKEMINKLANLGIEVDYEQLQQLAGEEGVGRPHLAQLLADEGHVASKQEAFDKYLADGGPAYVDKYQLLPKEAIELITTAGGVAVLAHPGIISEVEIVEELVQLPDLAGIEAYYPQHSPEQLSYYLRLASKEELIITGGSDCHGSNENDKLLLGTLDISTELLASLQRAIKSVDS
ncbi:PHP domain-containing protein [Natroniella sulfidigena]|uniref:PHP domain-containing protein n=1 Tax=Natroniella sulfidigena TaxID=723921 RepID=UPI00200B03EB|nr:PHP domain-containing protein [Natroniella sulfidigena]MCK8816276.1 PHP domain-containing protein [Natroniella sulfidigena]